LPEANIQHAVNHTAPTQPLQVVQAVGVPTRSYFVTGPKASRRPAAPAMTPRVCTEKVADAALEPQMSWAARTPAWASARRDHIRGVLREPGLNVHERHGPGEVIAL